MPSGERDRYHHGDLATALVRAGVDLLETGGLEAVSLRAAARAIGVSHAAPARHFAGADAFLAALATLGYQRLTEDLRRAAAAADPDPGSDASADAGVRPSPFEATGRAYVAFALAQPHWYRLLFHPGLADKSPYPDLAAASAETFDLLRHVIDAAMRSADIGPGTVDDVALTVWSTMHGLATLLLDHQLAGKDLATSGSAPLDVVLATLYLGLAARP